MAKRKVAPHMPDMKEDAAKLTIAELNQRIVWAKWRFDNAEKPPLQKSALKVLQGLESIREERYGIPAPRRQN